MPALIKRLTKAVFIKPTVTAWTGVAGTGKKLETLELDWTTGDLLLNFEKTDFMFKGASPSPSPSPSHLARMRQDVYHPRACRPRPGLRGKVMGDEGEAFV